MIELKRVSYKVAKAIKEAGYPQGQEEYAYRNNGEIYIFENIFDHIPDYCCDAPTYMEVWLWLWQEKKIAIELFINDEFLWFFSVREHVETKSFQNPEEAIIAAIEYLVTNDLIK